MPEVWVYIFGGVLIGLLTLTIAYNLLHSSITYSQRQDALDQFNSFVASVERVCLQEKGNSESFHFSLPHGVRVIFSTDEAKIPLKVYEHIKNGEMSEGRKICLQFKDENFLRCYPEGFFECKIRMPYLGVLPEKEDIFVAVNRILGRGERRDYDLLIQKSAGDLVEVILE